MATSILGENLSPARRISSQAELQGDLCCPAIVRQASPACHPMRSIFGVPVARDSFHFPPPAARGRGRGRASPDVALPSGRSLPRCCTRRCPCDAKTGTLARASPTCGATAARSRARPTTLRRDGRATGRPPPAGGAAPANAQAGLRHSKAAAPQGRAPPDEHETIGPLGTGDLYPHPYPQS